MSNELVALAYRARVGNGVGKAVLAAMADQANADGYCWPSIRYIVERTEWDRKTVERWIEKLEELGHLTVLRAKGARSMYQVHPIVPPGDGPTWDSATQVPKPPTPEGTQGENGDSDAAAPSVAGSDPEQVAVASDGENSPATGNDDKSTWVPQSHVENQLGSCEFPEEGWDSPTQGMGPTVPGVGTLGPKPGSHSPTNHKNLHLTSIEPLNQRDGVIHRGESQTGAEQLFEPPRSSFCANQAELEKRKVEQLERITTALRAKGAA